MPGKVLPVLPICPWFPWFKGKQEKKKQQRSEQWEKLKTSCRPINFSKVEGVWFKMARLEDPTLTSSHAHTDSTASCGTISFKKEKKQNKNKGCLSVDYTSGKRKPHGSGQEKLGHNLTINPVHSSVTHNEEKTQNPGLILEE